MHDAKQVARSIADTLAESNDAREELIALGIVVSGVISETPPEGRSELVDVFCDLVRKSVAGTLN